jgi:hypothetical protein
MRWIRVRQHRSRLLVLLAFAVVSALIWGLPPTSTKIASTGKSHDSMQVERTLGDVLLTPGVAKPIRATFPLHADEDAFSGEYVLGETSCACTGSLPERIVLSREGVASLLVEPRITYQNQITNHSWRARYNRASAPGSGRSAIDFVIRARLVPRLRYRIVTDHSGSVVRIPSGDPHFLVEVDTAWYNHEPSSQQSARVEIAESLGVVEAVESGTPCGDGLSGILSRRQRFTIRLHEARIASGNRAVIPLVIATGEESRINVSLVAAPEHVITCSPEGLFLTRSRNGEFLGSVSVSGGVPFVIERAELSIAGGSVFGEFGSSSNGHVLNVRVPREVIGKATTDGKRFVKATLEIQTSSMARPKISVPVYCMFTTSE